MTEQPIIETTKLNIEGVVLHVRIDYREKTASFMDEKGNPQTFKFTQRGREYLGGWVKIYRALEQATVWADEKLAAEEARQDQADTERTINLMMALADLKEPNS